MNYFKSKEYLCLTKKHNVERNFYYSILLDEKIYPLSQIHGTKNISIGMEDVELILSMGFPNKINRTTNAQGVSEQWIYRDLDVYVYLDDGIVTSFQN